MILFYVVMIIGVSIRMSLQHQFLPIHDTRNDVKELDRLEERVYRDHTIIGSPGIHRRVLLGILESPTKPGTLAAVAIG